jgi:hypothetical protein
MKAEDHAWRALQNHASAQLHRGFADRVLRVAHGPQPEVWQQMQARAATQIRPGFAARVLRMARDLPGNVPSMFDQLVLGAATMAVCFVAVFFIHSRSVQQEDQRILASWQQLAAETQEYPLDR